jgi:hypothetical protein
MLKTLFGTENFIGSKSLPMKVKNQLLNVSLMKTE